MLAAGFLAFFIDVFRSARAGPSAGANPWDAPTLEWATTVAATELQFRATFRSSRARSAVGQPRRTCRSATGCASTGANWSSARSVEAVAEGARSLAARIRSGRLLTAIATSVMLIWSIFTPWAVVWGSIPVAIALIGWFWPKGTPEDRHDQ